MNTYCIVRFERGFVMAHATITGICRHPLNDDPDYSVGWFYTDDKSFKDGVNIFINPTIAPH